MHINALAEHAVWTDQNIHKCVTDVVGLHNVCRILLVIIVEIVCVYIYVSFSAEIGIY